jgi:hypothetical protein
MFFLGAVSFQKGVQMLTFQNLQQVRHFVGPVAASFAAVFSNSSRRFFRFRAGSRGFLFVRQGSSFRAVCRGRVVCVVFPGWF